MFDNGSLGIVDVEEKTAETWVYVPDKTIKLKIIHPQLGHLTNGDEEGYFWFPERVESGQCYKIELVSGTVRTIVEEAKIQTGWVVFNSVPEGAEIYLAEPNEEEKYIGLSPVSKKMPYGNYHYRAKKYKYHDDVGLVLIDKPRVMMPVNLRPASGSSRVLRGGSWYDNAGGQSWVYSLLQLSVFSLLLWRVSLGACPIV